MAEICDYIKMFEENGIEAVVADPNFPKVLGKLQDARETPELDGRGQRLLEEAQAFIQKQIEMLQEEAGNVKSGMDAMQKNAEACLAYLDSARKASSSKKGKL